MKRLVVRQHRYAEANWPEPRSTVGQWHLFRPRPPFRRLVVLVDADLVADAHQPADGDPASLLAGLLCHPYFDVWRYDDDGPPADAIRPDHAPADGPFALAREGWAVLDTTRSPERPRAVVLGRLDTSRLSSISGNAPDVAAADRGSRSYAQLDEAEAACRREADAIASLVATRAVHADVHVTGRAYLHERPRIGRDTTTCTVAEALGVIGLYLRSQGVYVVDGIQFDRGLFFGVAVRTLLPASPPWFAACARVGEHLLDIADSTRRRLERALVARDSLHVWLAQPQDNATRDEVLALLDEVLLLLMGAVDAAARVAHHVCGLGEKDWTAAWQKATWLTRVGATAPGLAAAVADGTSGNDVLEVLRLFRNGIHGEGPRGWGVIGPAEPQRTAVEVPARISTEISAVMGRLGGAQAWGVVDLVAGRLTLDPGVFVDELLVRGLDLLDELLRRTPFADAGVDAADSTEVPFESSRRSGAAVLSQLGLPLDSATIAGFLDGAP